MQQQGDGGAAAARRLIRAAALADAGPAFAAWQAWQESGRPRLGDPAAQWWFPLIWWNLRAAPVAPADRSWLRQTYHDAWIRNQHLSTVAGETVAALERASIETIVLKGAALALTAYERTGLRPFGDVDVLVSPLDAEGARAVLSAQGWTPIRGVASESLGLRHSLGHTNGRGVDLDLHWVSLREGAGNPASDRGFRERAVPLDMPGAATQALAPADQLLHVLVHGLRWAPVPTDHWLADAMTLLRRAGDAIDWDVLLQEARARRLTLQVRRALELLQRDHQAPVPDAAIAALERTPASWWERVEYAAKRRKPAVGALVVQLWCQAARRGDHLNVQRIAASVRAMAGVDGWRALVAHGMARVTSRDRRAEVRTVNAYGRTIRIAARMNRGDGVDAVLARLPSFAPAPAGAAADRDYDITHQPADGPAPAHYRVMVNHGLLAAAPTLDEAAQAVAVDLQTFLVATASDVTFVHAGVVGVDGRAIVLPAASGAGKSTLVAALLRAGATYVSDEFALVRHDGRVEPFARPLVLRDQGGEHAIAPDTWGAPTAPAALPVGVVLFTHFTAGAAFAPERLSRGAAMFRLLRHCPGAQVRPVDTLARLKALTASATAWTTPRGEADAVANAIASGRLG